MDECGGNIAGINARIRNAKLELFDAADGGGKPVCVVEYKDGKIVGMDPTTRVVTWSGRRLPSPRCSERRTRPPQFDCKGDGWLPDSMVPWTDPWDNKRIGDPYGAPFAVESGTNAIVWVEIYVPEDAMPGDYRGSLEVTLGGKTIATLPVMLTVWPVTQPKTTTLLMRPPTVRPRNPSGWRR